METIERSGSLSGKPGGLILSDRAVELGRFRSGAKILDLGCGSGETVRHLRSEYGFEASGIDKNLDQSSGEPYLIMGYAEDLPFQDGYMDGILTECSFSLFEDQAKAVQECSLCFVRACSIGRLPWECGIKRISHVTLA